MVTFFCLITAACMSVPNRWVQTKARLDLVLRFTLSLESDLPPSLAMMVNTISPAPGDSPPSSTKGRADRMTLPVACSLSKIAHASGFVHLFLFGHCPTSQKRQRLLSFGWLVVSFMKNDMFYDRSLSELCQIFRPRTTSYIDPGFTERHAVYQSQTGGGATGSAAWGER